MTLMPTLGGSSTPKAVFLPHLLPCPPDHQAEHSGAQAAGGGQLRAEGCAAGGAASSSTLGVCHWERRQWQIPGTSPASACCPSPLTPPRHPPPIHPTCLPEAPPLALLEAMVSPGGWHRATPVAVTLAYSEPVTICLQGGMLSLLPRPISEDRGTRGQLSWYSACLTSTEIQSPEPHKKPSMEGRALERQRRENPWSLLATSPSWPNC